VSPRLEGVFLYVDLVKIVFVAVAVIVLLRLKIGFGVTLLFGAAALGLLFFEGSAGDRLIGTASSFAAGALAGKTLVLLAVLVLVLILGSVFQHTGNADKVADSLSRLIPDHRIGAVLPAMLIGFLPMLGGAMLSAPMVKRFADRMRLSPEQTTFANYWFRHVWEFSWPLYVGLLLAADILDVPLRNVVLRLVPLTFAAIFFGWVLRLRFYPPGKEPAADPDSPGYGGSTFGEILRVLSLSWPILTIIVLFLLFNLPLLPVLAGTVAVDLLLAKPSRHDLLRIVRSGFDPGILLVGLGVMVFARVLQDTDALGIISELSADAPLLSWPLVFLVPFAVGFSTGVNHTFVGIGFPLILPLLGTGADTSYSMMVLAFTGGFIGIMLTPFHLCLALTREYFGARWGGVYRLLLPPALCLVATSIFLAFLYR